VPCADVLPVHNRGGTGRCAYDDNISPQDPGDESHKKFQRAARTEGKTTDERVFFLKIIEHLGQLLFIGHDLYSLL
jgi:hypothetical protein